MASILPQPLPEKVVVTREELERICAPAFDRIKQPLLQVLQLLRPQPVCNQNPRSSF
jgi:hypothetical protein